MASRRTLLNGLAGAGSVALGIGPMASAGRPAAPPGNVAHVDDFLSSEQRSAAGTQQPLDCTDAFARALATGMPVVIGAGNYGLAGLRLPNGCSLTGYPGAMIHQSKANTPAIHCVSDAQSGQLAGIEVSGLELAGHVRARCALVLLEAHGGYAIWRSRFVFVARRSYRALEVQASDANNVFECEIDVVSEGTSDVAVLVRGGVYNRYHLFLTQTRAMAVDDASGGSWIRVVAENSVIFRGQNNQVVAHVEGIAAPKAANEAAIVDRGFGNTFFAATVNMPSADGQKLRYAFQAFRGSVFINPQVIGAGAPPHPFGPTSNFPFTIVGGRSGSAHKIEKTFDGSDPDHDVRNVTLVGDVRDLTDAPTCPGTINVQRVVSPGDVPVRLKASTQALVIDVAQAIPVMRVEYPGGLAPRDGWVMDVVTTNAVRLIEWPAGKQWVRLPRRLLAGERFRTVFDAGADPWLVL